MAEPTLLLTRPRAQSARFAAHLDTGAARVLIAPLMQIEGTDTDPDIDGFAGVIFTSLNGVAHAPEGQGRAAYCVGAGTTREARARGWAAVQSGETALELIADVQARRPRGPLLHLAGAHTRGDIAEALSDAGMPARRLTLYRQILLPLEGEARAALQTPCIVPLFSPRTAVHFAKEAGNHAPAIHLVALSSAVAAPLRAMTVANLLVLDAPQTILMRKAVENLCVTRALS